MNNMREDKILKEIEELSKEFCGCLRKKYCKRIKLSAKQKKEFFGEYKNGRLVE